MLESLLVITLSLQALSQILIELEKLNKRIDSMSHENEPDFLTSQSNQNPRPMPAFSPPEPRPEPSSSTSARRPSLPTAERLSNVQFDEVSDCQHVSDQAATEDENDSVNESDFSFSDTFSPPPASPNVSLN